MTARYPLVLNGTTIQELQSGDTIAGIPTTTGASILKGDGSGGITNATAGTDYVIPSGSVNYASSAGSASSATNATNATNAIYATSPASGGSFITTSNIGSQSVNYATTATNATNALGGPTSGQSWTDVTASRAVATTYTNSTGKPIEVALTVSGGSGGGGIANLSLNGTVAVYMAGNAGVSFVVPNGSTYSVASANPAAWSIGIQKWFELR